MKMPSFLLLLLAIFTFTATVTSARSPLHPPLHHGIYECEKNTLQASGYVDIPGVSGTQKHFFYWLFGPRRWPLDTEKPPPVIMWMTGGPGCSSGIALSVELGPCLMNESSGSMYHNPFGWNDEAYLLFVDQPVGVGYSYGDKINYAHNESEAADDMYHFLQNFARSFVTPSITGANDFYIIGESYGGHYVPSVAYRILEGNRRGDGPVINLKAISIGNGLTDPYTQYPSAAVLAYDWCKEKLGVPCVSDKDHEEMLSLLPSCLEAIAKCNAQTWDGEGPACAEAATYCFEYMLLYSNTGLNNYDIRKPCEGELCYPMDASAAFFLSDANMAALGVPKGTVWESCSAEVNADFIYDYHRNFNWTIPPLLAAGIRVHVYAGDMDFVCNWIGNKAWTMALEWPGKEGFNAAPDVEFQVAQRWAGRERTFGNFTFVQVYDAGHMVPMDQPVVALEMVHRFIRGKTMIERQ